MNLLKTLFATALVATAGTAVAGKAPVASQSFSPIVGDSSQQAQGNTPVTPGAKGAFELAAAQPGAVVTKNSVTITVLVDGNPVEVTINKDGDIEDADK